MKYKVHHFPISMKDDKDRLEVFLNNLQGEVITIIPNIEKTTLTQIYGHAEKIDFLLIIEGLETVKKQRFLPAPSLAQNDLR
jgi:hypothetical protein